MKYYFITFLMFSYGVITNSLFYIVFVISLNCYLEYSIPVILILLLILGYLDSLFGSKEERETARSVFSYIVEGFWFVVEPFIYSFLSALISVGLAFLFLYNFEDDIEKSLDTYGLLRIGTQNNEQAYTEELYNDNEESYNEEEYKPLQPTHNDYVLDEYVDSSCFSSVGYDNGNLYVKFLNSGNIYVYYNVSKNTYNELLEADSKGGYYNDYIKGYYYCERIE